MAAPWSMPAVHKAGAIAEYLRSQGLPADARILDVPCGIGRRALGLAEAGFDVTAIDANAVGIDAAKARVPQALTSRLRFRHVGRADLPGPVDRTFDAILSLDHPLGRGGPSEDASFLRRLVEHAGSQGRLAVELLHRDFFAIRPKPFSFHILGELEQHEFRTFDPVTGVLDLTWKFYERAGRDLRHRGESRVRMQLLAPHEVRALLEASGWSVQEIHGGWRGEPVTAERRKFVVVARPARA